MSVDDLDNEDDYHYLIQSSILECNLYRPIWDIFNEVIETGVRVEGLLGGLEPLCEAIEDYCIHEGINEIPPLYQYIFDARGGLLLTQSKAINYLRDAWLELFPTWQKKHVRDLKFETFLVNNNDYNRFTLDWFLHEDCKAYYA